MDDSDYDDYHLPYNSLDDEAYGSEYDTDASYGVEVEEGNTEDDDEEDHEAEMLEDAEEPEEDTMEDLEEEELYEYEDEEEDVLAEYLNLAEEEEPDEYEDEEEDVLAEYLNLEDGEDVAVETDYEEGELLEDDEEEDEPEEQQGVPSDSDEEDGTDEEDINIPPNRRSFRPRVPPPMFRFRRDDSRSPDAGGALVLGDDRGGTGSEAETTPSRGTGGNVDRLRGCGSQGHESNWSGFEGPLCPICFERWTAEGEHSVCCLPCGHLYGLSCIVTWLHQPDSQKCPQCNEGCEPSDIRRHYGVHLAATGDEELKQKVKSLEAKCAALELKDAIWLGKEAEWQKREADLEQQLKQHKMAGLVTDTPKQGDTGDGGEQVDNPEGPEPTNAHQDSCDGKLL